MNQDQDQAHKRKVNLTFNLQIRKKNKIKPTSEHL